MPNAYVVKAHVSEEGAIILDEPAVLQPGPVLLTVLSVDQQSSEAGGYTDEQHAELWQRLDRIAALGGPPEPDDGLSAKDAEAILYGTQHGPNDVR